MHEVVVTVFGVTGLLALVSLLPPLASRLNLPYTVLLAVVGCLLGAVVAAGAPHVGGGDLGPIGDFLGALHGFGISSEALLFIFLPTLLFESGLSIDVRRLMDDGGPILLLAVVAVLVCTFVVGYALSAVAEVGLAACLLLGSIVATTDPAAMRVHSIVPYARCCHCRRRQKSRRYRIDGFAQYIGCGRLFCNLLGQCSATN